MSRTVHCCYHIDISRVVGQRSVEIGVAGDIGDYLKDTATGNRTFYIVAGGT